MTKQSNSSPSNQPTRKPREITGIDHQSDSVGQAILGLLHTAADETETGTRQALETAQKLLDQLHAAQERIADLEAEVRLYREKARRAEGWLGRISTEIEDRLINEPEEKVH
jgi:uncharacterized protein YlxW (UPF0749 family)